MIKKSTMNNSILVLKKKTKNFLIL